MNITKNLDFRLLADYVSQIPNLGNWSYELLSEKSEGFIP